MILYVRQQAGLGDILFLQKAISYFVQSGCEVVWPVISHYEYIKEYNLNNKINYVLLDNLSEEIQQLYNSDKPIISENYIYIPFDRACQIVGDCSEFMDAKYKLINLDFNDWQNYINFKRFSDREKSCREKFGLSDGEKFIFVNSIFASPPNIYKREIQLNTDLKIIEQKEEHLNQFNFFDLSWILENAQEIHTVETSLCYLIECLNTTNKLFVYSRIINGNLQYSNFDYIRRMYKKDWKYII